MGIFSRLMSQRLPSSFRHRRRRLELLTPRPQLEQLEGRLLMHANVVLDAEHLAALTKTAQSFMNDFAPSLSPSEAAEMEAKMQVFSAVLNETRRNLRLFVLTSGRPDEFGYKPGRTRWVD